MLFEDLDKQMRSFETASDRFVLPEMYIVARIDGRSFTKLTKQTCDFEAPFDIRFHDMMVGTVKHLMQCGFNVVYGYTQSDEISLLLSKDDGAFHRKARKLVSILAGEASAAFSLQLGRIGAFDCRLCELPNEKLVTDYFRWRQADALRNALNAHCYWLLRRQGLTGTQATRRVSGLSISDKNELLFGNGINFNDLPLWQKRGVGLYFGQREVRGWNQIKRVTVVSQRRTLIVDEQLPDGEAYAAYLKQRLLPAK